MIITEKQLKKHKKHYDQLIYNLSNIYHYLLKKCREGEEERERETIQWEEMRERERDGMKMDVEDNKNM